MSAATSSKLDADRFRKVHTLMSGGATAGERKAATVRAEAMAAKAGMTLKQAVSSLDNQPKPSPTNFFEGFDDWCEERELGYKAKRAAEKAEEQRQREAVQRETLKEYGSEEAVFAETDRERRLRETLAPLADWSTYSNSATRYISGYAGWTVGRPPWKLVEALWKAVPFAADLPGLLREYREWERLYDVRYAFDSYYDQPIHVRARTAALEQSLDTLSDPTFEGFEARLEWLKMRLERDFNTDIHDDLAMATAMRIDFGVLRRMALGDNEPRSPLPRTTAEKRAAFLSMLDAHPELSDRKIGRRLGVSPQTVNTWRKKRVEGQA